MPDTVLPDVTVIVCTRYRSSGIVKTVKSVLQNDYPKFELLVIDQSEDNDAGKSLQQFLQDPRVRHIRTSTKGEATARNIGVRNAENEIVVFIDDDCEAKQDWVKELASAFKQDSRIGIIHGNVLPGPYERNTGFIPSYIIEKPFMARNISEKHKVEGISACMGLQKSIWRTLGGFDQKLGAGAPFKSAVDSDFVIRALLAGYYVYETPKVSVTHYGFRNWEEGTLLIKNYMYGLGAMLSKNLKCGHGSVLIVLFHLAARWAFAQPVVHLGPRPPRLMRLVSFMEGAIAGIRTPVDKSTGHYL